MMMMKKMLMMMLKRMILMMILGIDEDDVNNGDVGDSDKVYHDDGV